MPPPKAAGKPQASASGAGVVGAAEATADPAAGATADLLSTCHPSDAHGQLAAQVHELKVQDEKNNAFFAELVTAINVIGQQQATFKQSADQLFQLVSNLSNAVHLHTKEIEMVKERQEEESAAREKLEAERKKNADRA